VFEVENGDERSLVMIGAIEIGAALVVVLVAFKLIVLLV
jgi:hypothetical protein